MYNHITGTITHKSPTRIVVDCSGLGYDITLPLSAMAKLPPVGEKATILLHLVVREDELRLIGFASSEERELFRRLITLSGVGPALGLQILSGISPRDFALAVESQDAGALRKIKGVGEKTAKRIILELKGAKTILTPDEDAQPIGAAAEAAAALMALGLSQNEATARVEKALKANPDASAEDLIKVALR